MSAPRSSITTAKVCLPAWKVISFVIPAASTHLRNSSSVQALYLKSGNTLSLSLPLCPMYCSAWCDMSRYSWPLVFFCLNTILVNSPKVCTSPQVSLSMSLFRNPVRHEKRKASFKYWYLHGVAASFFTSSRVRYALSVSSCLNPSTPLMGLVGMIRSSKAWFMQALSLLKYDTFEFWDSGVKVTDPLALDLL